MTFEVAAEAYDRFMGRYSGLLAERFADWSGVSGPGRALDVGCGTGALTRVLVDRLGVDGISAVDPSQTLLAALRRSFPTLDVQTATAEQLPYPDDLFDHVLAQLVVSFLADPAGGLREMARVARPGGTVSACVWDLAGGGAPLTLFWRAARDLDPDVDDESAMPGTRAGDLARLCDEAGLTHIEDTALTVSVRHPTFEDWWEPYTFGVGPAGAHVRSLDETARVRLREHCRELLPEPPFDISATAWAVRARA
ncbi:class I SAM-dependent methyltransferase [Terrabacter aerolatus]|uniref:Methyltransferase n=1 Tax=Terrabacter aerolatus TaxID=422442 RepID=A0A512CVK0_9MICO|nr:class I SAM-dependent methyltransferase [Terrabacter aerolatus]GEO28226.1 methyltransferase [Terrabacter aerolatus]